MYIFDESYLIIAIIMTVTNRNALIEEIGTEKDGALIEQCQKLDVEYE